MYDKWAAATRPALLVVALAALASCDEYDASRDIVPPSTVDASRYLMVALQPELLSSGQQSYGLGLLALDPVTAAPTATPRRAAELGSGYPAAIVRHPSASWIYVAQHASGVSAFSIDPATAQLSPVPGGPFRTFDPDPVRSPAPVGLAFDAQGSRLFVAHDNSSDQPSVLEVFNVDPASGALQAAPHTQPRAGSRACVLEFDPGGRRLYVGSCFDHALHVFDVSDSGALTPAPGSPLVLDFLPSVLARDATGRWLLTVDSLREELVALPVRNQGSTPDVAAAVRTRVPGIYPVDLQVDRRSGWVYAYIEGVPQFRFARLRVDPDTGQAAVESAVPIDEYPGSMALEPGGRAVHILGQRGDRITTVRVPAPPAAMTEAPGTPVGTPFVYGVRPGVW